MNRRRFICIKCNYCYPCNQTFNIPPISQNPCLNCPPSPPGPQGVPGPSGNASALTITPVAGGTRPVSAHLVITKIA